MLELASTTDSPLAPPPLLTPRSDQGKGVLLFTCSVGVGVTWLGHRILPLSSPARGRLALGSHSSPLQARRSLRASALCGSSPDSFRSDSPCPPWFALSSGRLGRDQPRLVNSLALPPEVSLRSFCEPPRPATAGKPLRFTNSRRIKGKIKVKIRGAERPLCLSHNLHLCPPRFTSRVPPA